MVVDQPSDPDQQRWRRILVKAYVDLDTHADSGQRVIHIQDMIGGVSVLSMMDSVCVTRDQAAYILSVLAPLCLPIVYDPPENMNPAYTITCDCVQCLGQLCGILPLPQERKPRTKKAKRQ